MPSYYPAFLNLKDRRCAIIGGGNVAERKIAPLVECGANVTLISPEVTPRIEELHRQGVITWKARPYQPGDLEGAFLAIAATDDNAINRQVAREAERRKALLNVVDVTHLCTFIAPAIVQRGDITVAISTGGGSPALARKVRETLSESRVLEWADLVPLLSEVRQELRRRRIRVSPDHWQACLTQDLLDLYQQGKHQEARERLMAMLLNSQTRAKGREDPR